MQTPLQITIRNLPHSDALETRIRESAAKLERLTPRITSFRVTVEESHRHQTQGRQFEVRIDLRVPGGTEIFASHQDEDVYVAVRDAFDAARRQLE